MRQNLSRAMMGAVLMMAAAMAMAAPEFVFEGRRTFRETEPIVARVVGMTGEVTVTVHVASAEMAEWMILEREAAHRALRVDEPQRLAALRARGLKDGPAIATLHGAEVKIAPGFLPPGTYVLKAGEARDLFTIVGDTDYRRTLVTGINCYVLDDIPSIHNLVDLGISAVQVHARPRDWEQMDRMAAHGIRVISGATMLPPVPEGAGPTQFDGKPGGRQFYSVCYNKPQLKALMDAHCREVLSKVAAHPDVLAYWTINEVADHDEVCYCDDCKAAFRAWSKGKYQEAPKPPSVDPTVDRYAWYDWVRFRDASMRRFLGMAMDDCRRTDPARPVGNKGIIHNFFAHNLRSPWFEIGPGSDVFWYSSYIATWLDMGNYAEVATSVHEPAWISEFNHIGSPDAVRGAEAFSGYMHGLTGEVWFCYQPYAEGDAYFGIMERDWTRGEKYRGLAEAYRSAREIEPVLTEAPLVRQPVAVVWSDTSMIQATAPGEDGAEEHEFCGTVEALNRLHVNCRAVVDSRLAEEKLERFKIVFVPGARCVAPGEEEALEKYAKGGGCVVLDAGAGQYDWGKKSSTAFEAMIKEGRAYYCAFPLGEACFRKGANAPGLEAVRKYLEAAGVKPNLDADADVDAVVRQRAEGGVKYVLAVNYGEAGVKHFRVPGEFKRVRDIYGHEDVGCVAKGGVTEFEVPMDKWKPYAFALDHARATTWKAVDKGDRVEVTLDGEPGSMVSLQLVDGVGVEGPVVRMLVGEKAKLALRRYGAMRGKVRVRVKASR
jgi:hypothetical protein